MAGTPRGWYHWPLSLQGFHPGETMMTNPFEQTLLGKDPEFLTALRSASLVAAADVTTLILGESGTGKELVARALHASSARADGPFVAVNCAALPESLVESELFGHEKGAFTGADAASPGRIRAAQGGVLFLDEIGELPLPVQAKLLRFLESGECQPLGANTPVKTDIRVVAATHRDLYADVQAGRFREDLFYRLNIVPVNLPALRERRGDILLLLEKLTASLARDHGLPAPLYTREALQALKRYRWPGNVRELRNFCERMLVLFNGREIDVTNLPLEMRSDEAAARHGAFELPESGVRLEEVEVSLIAQALSRTAGNRSRAARLLGISRDTLLYRMRKYALD